MAKSNPKGWTFLSFKEGSKTQNNQSPNPNHQTITNPKGWTFLSFKEGSNGQFTNNQTKPCFGNWLLDIRICLVFVSWLLVISGFLSGCEQLDKASLDELLQADPSFKAVLSKKKELDSRIGIFRGQLNEAKAAAYANIKAIQENFNRQKEDIDSKIRALKGELEPGRVRIRQEMEMLTNAVSAKKATLRDLEATRRNLAKLVNQQKAVNVTSEEMVKWQERLDELDKEIAPLKDEVAGLEERLRLFRLKLIALRQ